MDHHDPVIERVGVVGMSIGPRAAELCALTWGDIDLEAGTVRIDTAVFPINDSRLDWDVGDTKTGEARTISIPDEGLKALGAQPEHVGEDEERVFPHLKDPDTFYTLWSDYLKDTDLRHLPPSGLRHTHTTLLLEQGLR